MFDNADFDSVTWVDTTALAGGVAIMARRNKCGSRATT